MLEVTQVACHFWHFWGAAGSYLRISSFCGNESVNRLANTRSSISDIDIGMGTTPLMWLLSEQTESLALNCKKHCRAFVKIHIKMLSNSSLFLFLLLAVQYWWFWAAAHIKKSIPALSYCNPVGGRHEAQMLWGSQRTMEGVQRHEGGGCEGGAVGHSEHVAAGTVRSITQTQRGFNPCHPFFPRKMKKTKEKKKRKKKENQT